MTFDVAETVSGRDRAALIDKFGGARIDDRRPAVRTIDERAIKAHADQRFRSEYDYALFEYYRSAKVIAFLERAGVALPGGCSMPGAAAAACRCRWPKKRAGGGHRSGRTFQDAGVRLGRERGLPNLHFALADGMACPFPTARSTSSSRTP